jgi:chitin synthase
MMKHFPNMKTTFCVDAKCQTFAPEKWSVLLSQRRRWINSTVHNLFELLRLSELCGFCCFSMRFIVFVDLLATFIGPSALIYIGWLIYSTVTDVNSNQGFAMISLIMIGAVYGFQVLIFLLKTQWQHVGWMILV